MTGNDIILSVHTGGINDSTDRENGKNTVQKIL